MAVLKIGHNGQNSPILLTNFDIFCIIILTIKFLLTTHEGVVKQLEITDIRVKMVTTDSRMKAVASVTFDNSFVVHDIKVIAGQDKLFTAMPSRRTPEGEYKDIAHPINSSMRTMLESQILAKYEEELSKIDSEIGAEE